MAVFRVERTQNYTAMSNYHLWDKRLSLKAKGLLSQMLSLPEDWDYTLSGLARINAEGKDAIRAAVVELEQAGYIQRRQKIDKAGKFSGNEYIIRKCPVFPRHPRRDCCLLSRRREIRQRKIRQRTSRRTDFPTQLKKEQKRQKNKILTYEVKNRFLSLPPPFQTG